MIEKTFPITEKLLAKGLELSLKLYNLLCHEESILKTRAATNDLILIATGKKEAVIGLERFGKQLAQILSTENLSMHHSDMEKYFQTAHINGVQIQNAVSQWEQIITVGKKCRSLNEQNGAAIDLLSRHNQRLLHILRGQSQFPTTYGPDGATRRTQFSQPLVSV